MNSWFARIGGVVLFPGRNKLEFKSFIGEHNGTEFRILHQGVCFKSIFEFLGKRECVTKDYEIYIFYRFAKQQIPNKSADHIDINLLFIGEVADIFK